MSGFGSSRKLPSLVFRAPFRLNPPRSKLAGIDTLRYDTRVLLILDYNACFLDIKNVVHNFKYFVELTTNNNYTVTKKTSIFL